jgi:hypothetical protein
LGRKSYPEAESFEGGNGAIEIPWNGGALPGATIPTVSPDSRRFGRINPANGGRRTITTVRKHSGDILLIAKNKQLRLGLAERGLQLTD